MISLLLFCIIIGLAPHALHHLLLAHIQLFYMLDHMESGPGVQVEQAQAKEFTNLVLDKGMSSASYPILDFYFELLYLY
jgi:hypothetical protein